MMMFVGCSKKDIEHVVYQEDWENKKVEVELYSGQEFCMYPYESITLDASQLNIPNARYIWMPWADTASSITLSKEVELFLQICDTVKGTCDSYLLMNVRACLPALYVPSAFTPNGDGINDYWGVSAVNIQIKDCNVYDWNGCLVYSYGYELWWRGWDGLLPSGKKARPGKYNYLIRYDTEKEENLVRTGTLQLIY